MLSAHAQAPTSWLKSSVEAQLANSTVSVIIPHFNDLKGLEKCLAALRDQTYPPNLVQIIVADNDSTVSKSELSQIVGDRATMVVVKERGAGPARNGGVAVATGEIFAFTDSDCVPDRRWLEEGVRALAGWDFIGGRVTVAIADPPRMTKVEAFERVFAFDFETYITKKGFTGAGNLFCPRDVFLRVGGFRAEVSEDVEWSRRARGMGYSLGYAPTAIVAHPARQSWDELWRKWERVNRETYILYSEQRFGRFRWMLRTFALPASVLVHLHKIAKSDQLYTVKQRFEAATILARIRLARMWHGFQLMHASGGNRK